MILCEPSEPHWCAIGNPRNYRIGTVAVCEDENDGCGKHWVVNTEGWGDRYWKRIHTKRGLKRLLKKAGCGQETS